MTIGSRQAVLVVQDTSFDPAVQLLSQADAAIGMQHRGLEWGTSVSLATVKASLAIRGTIYRGFSFTQAGVYARWTAENGLGVTLRGAGAFATYSQTRRLFFYPTLTVAPHWRIPLFQDVVIMWSLPLFYQFRHDLAYSFGAGIRGQLRLHVPSP